MHIMVMQKGTALYLGRHGAWVEHKRLALQFKSSTQALDYCLSKQLSEVDFLLHFEDSHWDIRVPSVLNGQPLPKGARKYFPPASPAAKQ